jgi:DNA helicase-2/ATP-dependent DNA helicase PcrA
LAEGRPDEIVDGVLGATGYRDALAADAAGLGAPAFEAQGRLENLEELVGVAADYDDLEAFLATTALVAATDDLDDSGGSVSLMTLHAAKGLEFDTVFLTGMEEGVFPHERAIADPDDLEEERRLCYVGITRAKRRLYLTHTWNRTLFGESRDALTSRFLKEIPPGLLEDVEAFAKPRFVTGRGGRHSVRAASISTGAESLGLVAGERIVHARWGEGTVLSVSGEGESAEATISFPRQGEKRFLLCATPLKRA